MAENVPETPKRNNLIDTGKLGVFDELLKASNKGDFSRVAERFGRICGQPPSCGRNHPNVFLRFPSKTVVYSCNVTMLCQLQRRCHACVDTVIVLAGVLFEA